MNDEITIDGVVYIRKDRCSCPFMNKENKDLDKKYVFTGETFNYHGHILHRITTLRNFGNVKRGDLGGWIEKEDNLSQEGDCWVTGNAMVSGNAVVRDNAVVGDNAKVYGDAVVGGNAKLHGYMKVFEGKIFS